MRKISDVGNFCISHILGVLIRTTQTGLLDAVVKMKNVKKRFSGLLGVVHSLVCNGRHN